MWAPTWRLVCPAMLPPVPSRVSKFQRAPSHHAWRRRRGRGVLVHGVQLGAVLQHRDVRTDRVGGVAGLDGAGTVEDLLVPRAVEPLVAQGAAGVVEHVVRGAVLRGGHEVPGRRQARVPVLEVPPAVVPGVAEGVGVVVGVEELELAVVDPHRDLGARDGVRGAGRVPAGAVEHLGVPTPVVPGVTQGVLGRVRVEELELAVVDGRRHIGADGVVGVSGDVAAAAVQRLGAPLHAVPPRVVQRALGGVHRKVVELRAVLDQRVAVVEAVVRLVAPGAVQVLVVPAADPTAAARSSPSRDASSRSSRRRCSP